MNYSKIPQDLPIEIVGLIMSYINMETPSAKAFKLEEFREIKNVELLSIKPLLKGVLVLKDTYIPDVNEEWEAFQDESSYWEGFYAAHDIFPDGFI